MGEASRTEQRILPGTPRSCSVLGFVVSPPSTGAPDADRQVVALLRKARSEGVTVFDVSGEAPAGRAQRLVAAAFPEFDPELVLLVGGGLSRPPATRESSASKSPEGEGPLAGLRASLAESRRRLSPQVPGILEWTLDTAPSEEIATVVASLETLRSSGDVAGWSLRLPPEPSVVSSQLGRWRPKLLSTEVSLLDPSFASFLDAEAPAAGFGVFVRNPFAGGLLDGTRFSSTLADRPPRSGPIDVRALRAEFDPVLRLGFLSGKHRRTLAQAALQYLLPRTWVTSVLLPLPRPERWEELFGAAATPPLSAEEFARVEAGGEAPEDRRIDPPFSQK